MTRSSPTRAPSPRTAWATPMTRSRAGPRSRRAAASPPGSRSPRRSPATIRRDPRGSRATPRAACCGPPSRPTRARRAPGKRSPPWSSRTITSARRSTPRAPAHAPRARGLEWDAERALDHAAADAGPLDDTPCLVVEALLRRADDRRELPARTRFEDALAACDATSEARLETLRARGELAAEENALRAALRLAPERDELAC